MDILGTWALKMNPWYYTDRKKRRLKRKIVTVVVVSLCLFQSPFAQDDESQCEVYTSENCTQEVRFKIGKKSAEMRKSYTLSMFTLQGDEEPVALFDYVGLDFYNCDPISGYVCQKENDTVFSIIPPCGPSTKFSFFAEGEKAIPCIMSMQKEKLVPELKSDWNKPVNFQNDASRNSHEIVVVAVFLGVIIPGATAAVLYFLLKKEILSTWFEKRRSKKVTEDLDLEEISSLSQDKTHPIKIDYEDEQRTTKDDTNVSQELS